MLGEVALPMKSEAGGSKEKVDVAGTEAEWVDPLLPLQERRAVLAT